MSTDRTTDLAAHFAQSMAQLCQVYGIPTKFGHLYALLFLSPEPMSLQELAAQSGGAKSSTSVALRKLERYRFVRRLPRASDRRDYYEPVLDPMQILRDWARLFLAPELALGEQMVQQLDQGLDAAANAGELDEDSLATLHARTELLRSSMSQGLQVLNMLTQISGADTSDPA